MEFRNGELLVRTWVVRIVRFLVSDVMIQDVWRIECQFLNIILFERRADIRTIVNTTTYPSECAAHLESWEVIAMYPSTYHLRLRIIDLEDPRMILRCWNNILVYWKLLARKLQGHRIHRPIQDTFDILQVTGRKTLSRAHRNLARNTLEFNPFMHTRTLSIFFLIKNLLAKSNKNINFFL